MSDRTRLLADFLRELEGYEHDHAYEHPEYRERLQDFFGQAARRPE